MQSFYVSLLVVGCLALPVNAATVTGRVVDERGRGLSGATVWLHLRPDPQTRPKPYSSWTKTAVDGTFTIAGAPAGQFSSCAQLPKGPYIDSCLWETPKTFALSATASLNLGVFQLREGHDLRVKVDDPKGEIYELRKGRKSPGLQIGVWTATGTYLPLDVKQLTPNGEEYGVLVPYDSASQLAVSSGALNLADEKGSPIDRRQGYRQTIVGNRGKQQAPIRFQVSGGNVAAPGR
jgi:hypothetical protein